eukprot:CAMPEP_0202865660 /NCGR_PEP_ID=MMETSP1391-20130828/6282_1 /ASSEMBLY_ACC=CAM_ASM_000867 /TAXON_ID=1034604 /ORGANISM="Chlamydomonas leiostraca, Strain SAG 11-49" /LENGTH=781 /DNA_ID=CAMNT_0049545523 /DNA_START=38 /DNA_END=2383 /DNA_ORIENTATION=-
MRAHCCLEHSAPSTSGRFVATQSRRTRCAATTRETIAKPQPAKKEVVQQQPNLLDAFAGANPALFAQQLINSLSQGTKPRAEASLQVLNEAHELEQAREQAQQPADISPFLSPVSTWELKHIRKLSHLTALTYKMAKLTPRKLKLTHGLDLVTTSWACEIRPYEHIRTAGECMEEGDGACLSLAEVRALYHHTNALSASMQAPTVVNNVVPAPKVDATAVATTGAAKPAQPAKWLSPTDIVASKVAEAAAAAAAAASSAASSAAAAASSAAAAASPIASTIQSTLYAGLASLPIASALGAGPRSSAPAAAAALMSAAAKAAAQPDDKAGRAVAASAAAGTIAIAAAPGSSSRLAAAAPLQSTTSPGLQPSEWFVCDDAATATRYIVIQGSDTIDHWRLNLTFDPVTFEDGELGVAVHRGVYEAAAVLYERFQPIVYEHIDSSPFAKVCFVGHSIGGSLGTLLALMYLRRGVLQPSQLATTYTFGAPAVFCMDEDRALSEARGAAAAAAAATGARPASTLPPAAHKPGCRCGAEAQHTLLTRLGLQEHDIRNVIMHRDIVPRAFACDYSLVADILKSWGPAFKRHSGLAHSGRKHLYYFVGRIMVLQPDSWHSFVLEPDHPMLPAGPELYTLANPAQRPPTVCIVDRPPAPSTTTTSTALERSAPRRRGLASAGEAVWELMDCPHPLDTLVEPGAYMATGSISRYHNPENYTAAFGRLIYRKRREEGRFPSVPYAAALRLQQGAEDAGGAAPLDMDVSPYDSSDMDGLLVTPPGLADLPQLH